MKVKPKSKGMRMPIRVTCACGKEYKFKNEVAGRRAKCPACGKIVVIPSPRVASPQTPAPGLVESSASAPRQKSKFLLFAGLGSAALILLIVGIGLTCYFIFKSSPEPDVSTNPLVATQPPAAPPVTTPKSHENKPTPAAPETTAPSAPPSGAAPPAEKPAEPAKRDATPLSTPALQSGRLTEVNYRSELDIYDLWAYLSAFEMIKWEPAPKIDVPVSESLLVAKVPEDFIHACVLGAKMQLVGLGRLGDKDFRDDKATLNVLAHWWFEDTPPGVLLTLSKEKRPTTLELITSDLAVPRRSDRGTEISIRWLFYPEKFRNRTGGLSTTPRWKVPFRDLLNRFDPESVVTEANASTVAEELVWAKRLGLGDGTPKTLAETRTAIQAAILEQMGFEIGNPLDTDPAKRDVACKKLLEARRACKDVWEGNVFEAIREHNPKRLIELLNRDTTLVKSLDSDGRTPLHVAAACQDKEMVQLLIGKGADVNARDKVGASPLHWSMPCFADETGKDMRDVVEILIAHGADVKAKSNNGNTPLHGAVTSKDITELLISKGADVNARNEERCTPLTWAVLRASADVVELLVSKGADVNAVDGEGHTPLYWAPGRSEKAVEILKKHGGVNK